jgi:hypothetical protein
MDSLFTYRDEIEGKVGIGRLPNDLQAILDDISKEYYNMIPDKNASTYHTWYEYMPSSIKSKIEQIQKNNFWNKLCDGSEKCVKINVNEMDELYYSNFKKTSDNVLSQNLYGATGNIVIHKDCHHICSFDNAKLYRILIGLTDENKNITTKFTNLGVEHKINKNDYVLFDFSRTTHQVIKENQMTNTPRILLKLHFIVFDNDNYSDSYIYFIKSYFINYDKITRYILKTGTEPETYYQFLIGLLTHFFYYPYTVYMVAFMILFIIVILNVLFKIKLIYKNITKIIKYVLFSLIFIYLLIVLFYWLRYKLLGIK